MTISIIRMPFVPQLWDGCDVSIPEDEYHARLNRYLYEWRYRYESTVNTIIGLSSPLTTKGDVWGFSTVNARIPVGANGFVLTADSTQALGVKWAAATSGTTSPLTTKGDLWGFSTVDARLPVGTNNFVLTADSTQALGVKWAAAAAAYTLTTQEEGGSLSSTVNTLNFTGARVTASGAGATTTVAIPATLTTKGDLLGYSSAEARIPVGPDGTVLTADSSATLGVSWKPDTASDRWSWVFGSGYDGAFTADGASAMPGATRSGSVYTLTRTVSFTDLTVDSGVRIYGAGKGVVLVKDTLLLNGVIEADGLLGRTPYAADFYTTQATGGGLATAGGAQGTALGGAGAAAGLLAGGGGVGGGAAGGAVTVPPANMGGITWSYLLQAIAAGCGRASTTGYGGGAAGGGGTGGGFPGGHGGGCIAVLARIIDPSSTGVIRADGGNGTNATASNGGGGGGGGGGRAWLVTTTSAWSSYITMTANGGTGGNPNGTGNFGANGSAGVVSSLILA